MSGYEDDVLFKVGLTSDPASAAALETLASKVEQTMARLSGSTAEFSRQLVAQVAAASQEANSVISQGHQSARDGDTPSASSGEVRFSSMAEQSSQMASKLHDASAKMQEDLETLADAYQQVASASEASASQMLDDLMHVSAESERLNDTASQQAQSSAALGKNFRDLAQSAEGVAGGIGQLAGGLAFLGAKNQDVEKLVQTLLTIKGFVEIGTGTVKTISSIVQAVSLWKERQQLQTAAGEASEAQTRQSEVAMKAYLAAMERYQSELKQAAAGNRDLAASLEVLEQKFKQVAAAQSQFNAKSGKGGGGAGGFAAGAFSSVVGGVMSGQDAGQIGAGIAQDAAYQFAGSQMGQTLGMKAARLAMRAGPVGGLALAGTALVVGPSYLKNRREAAQFRKQEEGFAALEQKRAQDRARVEEMQSLAGVVRSGESAKLQSANESASLQDQFSVASGEMTTKGANANEQARIRKELERQLEITKQYKAELSQTAGLQKVSSEQNKMALEASTALRSKLVSQQQSEIGLVQQEASERQKLNDMTITGLERRIELSKREGEQARDTISSAQDRFADLSLGDKRSAIAAKRKLDTQGYKSLGEGERSALGRIGTGETQEALRNANRDEAEKFGFTKLFAGREAAALTSAEASAKKLQADVKVQQDLNVKVDIDSKATIDKIVAGVKAEINAQAGTIQETVNSELQAFIREQNRKAQAADMQRRNASR